MFTPLSTNLFLQGQREREPVSFNHKIKVVIPDRASHEEVTHEAAYDNNTFTARVRDTESGVDDRAQGHGAYWDIFFERWIGHARRLYSISSSLMISLL